MAYGICNKYTIDVNGESKEIVGFYGYFESESAFDKFYMDIKRQFKEMSSATKGE